MPDLMPGEIALETPAPPPAADPEPAAVAEPVADPEPVVAAADPEPEPVADPAPAAKPKHILVPLSELIEERTRARVAERRLAELEPTLSRLNPDIELAIREGRVQVQPKQTQPDAERARLTAMATELQLFKPDTTDPDLDAAARVDRVIRSTVQREVQPLREVQQQSQHQSLQAQAKANVDAAIKYAAENGYDVATIAEVFNATLASPTGAQILAQRDLANQTWKLAVGEAAIRAKAAPPQSPKAPAAAVVVAPPTGRGSSTATVTLSPAIAKVYRDHGIDPAKPGSKPLERDANGFISLGE